jgi:hypothetical protein
VLALPGFHQSATPLEAETSGENPLSVRAAMVCIFAASVLGWAAILLPLWAAIG